MQNQQVYSGAFASSTKIDRAVCIATILVGCAAAIFWWWSRQGLWEDEIIAITHANQPLPLFFVEVLRNDIHPPLYFFQLKLWQDLGFQSDRGILVNSLVWALISLCALFYMTKSVYGEKAAWYATAIYAIFPIFAYSAANLRMYCMVPAMAVLVWYSNYRWFESACNKWLVISILAELALAYLHAIEFYFVAFIAAAALAEALFQHRLEKHDSAQKNHAVVRKWLFWQAACAVLILPLIGSAIVRGSDASAPALGLSMLLEPGALVAGWSPSSILPLRIAGLVIFCILAVLALGAPSSRLRTIIIPIGALAVAIAVSMLAKPMLKIPVFAANLLPFLAMGAGVGAALSPRFWVRSALYGCLALLCAASFPLVLYQLSSSAYKDSGRYLAANAQPGDIVLIPNVSVYWGILRYAVGPRWGKPLEVMPLQPNPQWAGLTARLGPAVTEMLGLRPETDTVTHKGVRYTIGEDARKATGDAKKIWVVHRNGYLVDVELGGPFVRKSMVRIGAGDLVISSFESDPAGKPIARHPLRLGNDAAMKIEQAAAP
ncbi:MAG: glycosyltransferase family 39 protein [Noviherbaspirillum sp.]